MSFVNWVIDTLANEDVIDLYFILSDMFEINLTEAEITETAYFDSMATAINEENSGRNSDTPLGKTVL